MSHCPACKLALPLQPYLIMGGCGGQRICETRAVSYGRIALYIAASSQLSSPTRLMTF